MANTVFFAWQMDTKPEDNKSFIWSSIVSACKKCKSETTPELSPRPEKDTDGVSGSPNIVQTIFKKIDGCALFVADVTFIAKTDSSKYIPNPNVLIELGYAVKTIGWERTILVINSAHGKASELPFDILQHRWPVEYRITNETIVREKRWNNLEAVLCDAISGCEEHSLSRAKNMAISLDTDTLAFVAKNEKKDMIDIQLPAQTMGQHLTSALQIASIRRLMDLGAIRVISNPELGYGWTYDGLNMIKEIYRLHPHIMMVFRGESG